MNYVRITYPKIQFFDNSGQFAVGYKVYTIKAGTVDTLQTTWQDRLLTAPNVNPVILDSRGEANIYTNTGTKLVFTTPTGDLSSPIITVDYVGEQQETVIVNGNATAGTTDNNYVLNVTPTFLSIPANLTVVMNPDVDNEDTLVLPYVGASSATVFTGSGINDIVFSGPYVGSTAGSVFTVELMGPGLPIATTIAENVAVGSVDAGDHYVKLTAVTATGESLPGAVSNLVTAAGSKKIDVTGIPAIGGLITGYKVYMTKAGGTDYYYVATVTATTYTINVADVGLTVLAPTVQTATDWIRWKKDGGSYTDQNLLTAVKQNTIEGISFQSAEIIGHTVGDIWTVTVTTPATLNFCGLGKEIIYKNVAGTLKALDGGDLKQGIPATLVWATGASGWILNNPSLPVLATIKPYRERKEIAGNYTVLVGDIGKELSCTGTFTVSLPVPASLPNHWWYIRNSGGVGTIITVDAGTGYLIKGPEGFSGQLYYLHPGDVIQLENNGVNFHILATAYHKYLTYEVIDTPGSGDWAVPSGVRYIDYILIATGGGGGSAGGGATPTAAGGGAGGDVLRGQMDVSAVTTVAYTVPADAAGGTGAGGDGTDGGDTVFGSITAKGGKAGKGDSTGLADTLGGVGGSTDLSGGQTSLLLFAGESGGNGVLATPSSGKGGNAGSNRGIGGAALIAEGTGTTGTSYGGAGAGGLNTGAGNQNGGTGKQGAIIIWY